MVQLGFSFFGPGSPSGINGRWASGGYSPYTYATTLALNVVNTLGTHDNTNPLMQGVGTLRSNFHNIVTPSAGATQVAAWNNGDSLIAYKLIPGGHITFGITAYLGPSATWMGDFARVIANAGRWAGCFPLELTAAASRKVHAATPFEINLPLSGEPGVECRSGAAGHTIVFRFNNPVAAGTATVTSGIGNVGGVSFSGNTMTVPLTGVADLQKIVITLAGVTGANGAALPTTSVSMNVLLGDTTGNKAVSASDIGQTKSQAGLPVTSTNFRNDTNVSGTITASDIGQVKANAGHTLP